MRVLVGNIRVYCKLNKRFQRAIQDYNQNIKSTQLKYDKLLEKEKMIISLIKSSSPERLNLMIREMTNIPQDIISKLKVSGNH